MKNKETLLLIVRIILIFVFVGVIMIFKEVPKVFIGSMTALILLITHWSIQNRKAVNRRTAAFGINSGITILLVLGLVGVVNFLLQKHVWKWDLSRAKLNTLSDQTQKVVKGLKTPVKAVIFTKSQQEEKMKTGPLFDNYRALNSLFEIEYVDPDKETARAAAAGIKNYQTVVIHASGRESKIEDVTEEKITNTLIKLTSEKATTICAVTQHGEKSFQNTDALSYSSARKILQNQSYDVKEINIRGDGKIPESCTAVVILGAASAFFPAEVTILSDYLNKGGRAYFAFDVGLKGNSEPVPELIALLKDWGLRLPSALILDPLSKMNQLEATVPATSTFAEDHKITSELQGAVVLPLVRPIEILKESPKGLKTQWLIQTTPGSWAKGNIASLSKGGEVKVFFDEKSDIRGPLNVLVAVAGKREGSNATRDSRIVVAGTSLFPTNQWGRFGVNFDLFANSISWLADDENLISIRDRQDENSLLQINSVQGSLIFYVTVILIPFGIAVTGVVVWWRRRRL